MYASIPSPSANSIGIGPLALNAYGLMIALGVLAAVSLARRRWAARGGDPELIAVIATWAVPAGLVGARIYHVITDWRRFQGRWLDVFAIWEGGLGIPGGLLAGAAAGCWVARRNGAPVRELLDVVAPAIPVAQAIGRLGNWFNQELFGKATDLPWALEIDVDHRPAGMADVATYHPTFLYEALWNLGLAAALIFVVERRVRHRPGTLFAVYIAGYALGRFWVEALRIDTASEILGWRVNLWVSSITFVVATIVILVRSRGDAGTEREGVDPDPVGDTAAGADEVDEPDPAPDRESMG